jgi:hypothetical protein
MQLDSAVGDHIMGGEEYLANVKSYKEGPAISENSRKSRDFR